MNFGAVLWKVSDFNLQLFKDLDARTSSDRCAAIRRSFLRGLDRICDRPAQFVFLESSFCFFCFYSFFKTSAFGKEDAWGAHSEFPSSGVPVPASKHRLFIITRKFHYLLLVPVKVVLVMSCLYSICFLNHDSDHYNPPAATAAEAATTNQRCHSAAAASRAGEQIRGGDGFLFRSSLFSKEDFGPVVDSNGDALSGAMNAMLGGCGKQNSYAEKQTCRKLQISEDLILRGGGKMMARKTEKPI